MVSSKECPNSLLYYYAMACQMVFRKIKLHQENIISVPGLTSRQANDSHFQTTIQNSIMHFNSVLFWIMASQYRKTFKNVVGMLFFIIFV